MSLKNGTICDKHKKIMDLVDQVQDLAIQCKEDGQRMEDGLDKKRKTIIEIEKDLEDQKKENEKLLLRIDDLEDQIKEMKSDLKEERAERAYNK